MAHACNIYANVRLWSIDTYLLALYAAFSYRTTIKSVVAIVV